MRCAERAIAVAVRRLDLDDLGAHVREHLARERAQHHGREFEDLYAFEGSGHRLKPLLSASELISGAFTSGCGTLYRPPHEAARKGNIQVNRWSERGFPQWSDRYRAASSGSRRSARRPARPTGRVCGRSASRRPEPSRPRRLQFGRLDQPVRALGDRDRAARYSGAA